MDNKYEKSFYIQIHILIKAFHATCCHALKYSTTDQHHMNQTPSEPFIAK